MNNSERCDNNGKYWSLEVERDSSMAQVFWFSNHLLSSMLQNVLLFLGQLSLVKKDKMFSLSVYHFKAILCYLFGYLRVLFYLSGITIRVRKLRVRKVCNCWWSLAAGDGIFTDAFPLPKPLDAWTHGFHSCDFTPPNASVLNVKDRNLWLFWSHSEKQLVCPYVWAKERRLTNPTYRCVTMVGTMVHEQSLDHSSLNHRLKFFFIYPVIKEICLWIYWGIAVMK